MWQVRSDGIYFAAQIVKDRPHDFVTFFEVRVDNRNAGPGFARDRVDLRHFLNRFFDLVRYEQFNTLRTGAGKRRCDHSSSNDKPGVLRLWQALIGKAARDDQQSDDRQRDAIVPYGECSEIHIATAIAFQRRPARAGPHE